MTTRDDIKRRFGIVGNHPQLNRAVEVAIQVAPTEVSVLVVGENGTGKDVFSRIIHQLSARKHQKFIAINAGAIPEGTIDSELFGHEKGAFTSAYEARKGYFEEANGGVIFLDEIAELPVGTQSRLLRVLENGEYLRVGSSKVLKTDVRVVAATNKNLIQEIRTGRFREDLYFRLNTITVYVPPLRERGDDLDLLFRYFAAEFATRYGRPPVAPDAEARQLLHQYHWPGNVRELRNFVEKVTVLNKGETIAAEAMRAYLPQNESLLPVAIPGGHRPTAEAPRSNGHGPETEMMYRALYELRTDLAELKFAMKQLLDMQKFAESPAYRMPQAAVLAEPGRALRDFAPVAYPQPGLGLPAEPLQDAEAVVEESLSIEQKERDLILKALERHHQNRKKAAVELGISERTLYRKIKSYGLDK